MLLEPSGSTRPARRSSLSRLSRRGATAAATRPAAAFAIAAAVLAVTGRGDLFVVAVLLGLADTSAAPVLVVAAAGAVALDRIGSAGLADIAGAQSVLGAAGWHGSGRVVLGTWAVALGLVVVCRRPLPSAVAGAVAGLLVAGPALSGGARDVALRVAAMVVGAALGWLVAPRRAASSRQRALALGFAALGVACVLM